MRLKQLELVGFKSFPTRTTLDFPSGVTGVVGPNGCGKSNIVDAMRWVLGEQSPKHLRGDSMESVIFNGNDQSAPLGMAEVSLTFENDEPSRAATELDQEMSDLPAQFRDLAEIMITRRYYRSGESEYYINKTSCRLKDITELFLGTGVGSKAYAIIEQGRVSEMISAKPEERRLFIEEAAGTTLYRSRKLAAERKMERTRENLSRVTDILSEIDRQRRYIERQAKKAETHRRISDELRELDLRIASRHSAELETRARLLNEQREVLHQDEAATAAVVDSGESERSRAEESRAEAEQRQSALRESLAVLDSERQSLAERVALLTGERDERERRRQRLTVEIEEAKQGLAAMGSRMVDNERERDESVGSLQQDEAELKTVEQRQIEAAGAVSEVEAQIEADKNALVAHVAEQAQAHNAMSTLQHRAEDIDRRQARLRDESGVIDQRISEAADRRTQAVEALSQLRDRLASATQEQEQLAEDVRRQAEERRRLDRQISEFEGQLIQAKSRLESLIQIQSRYEGFERGVRAVMGGADSAGAHEGILGVVADVIGIPQEYERAAAAVLGDRLQYVIVRGEEEGAGAVDRLRRDEQGRGSFIPLHPRQIEHTAAQMNGASKRMLELVKFDESFRSIAESLLGDVVVVPDLTSAVSAWRDGGKVTMVTPDGDVMQPSGVITGGSDRPVEEEILARRREIESLSARAEETQVEIDSLRQAHASASELLEQAEQAVQSAGEGAHDLTVSIVAAEKDIERFQLEIPEFERRREVVRFELETLTEEAETVSSSLLEHRETVTRLEEKRREIDARSEELRRQREEVAGRAETVRADVTAVKIRVAERRERQQSALAALASLTEQQRELYIRQQTLGADLQGCASEFERLNRDIEEAKQRGLEGEQRQEEVKATLAQVSAEVEERSTALREKVEIASAGRQRLDKLRKTLQEVEIGLSEARLKTEHLATAIQEKYECDVPGWQEPDEPVSEEALAQEAEQADNLRRRLAKMGDVNAAAIDELRELEERSEYLTAQRDDLERSLADLEKTIQKLNRASRTKFAETFAQANETFQKVFPRLFRGGEGRLVLTDENNLLESGVDIIVRPPGKRLDTVSLLSGGEKALVAVSLIFSLFLINPTPFCILDEVDAPLDDANIGRFSQMIAEMSEHSQFIIVTHNKRTMESSNVLYGVTMQQPGVSRIVSVSMS